MQPENDEEATLSDLPEPPPARFTLRVFSFALDVAILMIIEIGVSAAFGSQQDDGRWHTDGLVAAALILFYPLFWFVPDALLGRSLGEAMLSLRVLRVGGGDIRTWQRLCRGGLKMVEFPVLFLPSLIVAFNNSRRQTIGELLAGLYVTEQGKFDLWRMGGSGEQFHEWLRSMKEKSPENKATESSEH